MPRRSVPAGSLDLGDQPAGVQPSSAASAAHRVRRSVTPLPVLCARVSADASRHSAARSQRVGSRPSRSRNSSTLTASAVVDLAGALREHLEQLAGHAGDLGLTVDDRLPRRPRSGGSARPAAPTGTGRPASAGAASGSGRRAPATGRRRSGPWPRSRRGCAAAGRRPATSSGGTWPRSTRACRDAGDDRSTRTRVVAPNRSRCSSAARTATSCASSRPGSPVSAHHTLSDFGAENVASNPATARTTLPLGQRPVDERVAQRCPSCWVTALQKRSKIVGVDRAVETEPGRLPAGPHAGLLAGRLREVAGVVRRGRRRRRRVQGGHPQHQRSPPPSGHLSVDPEVHRRRRRVGMSTHALGRAEGWRSAPCRRGLDEGLGRTDDGDDVSAGPVAMETCGRWAIGEADDSTGSCELVQGPARDSHPGSELHDRQTVGAAGGEVGPRQLVGERSTDAQPLRGLVDRQQLQLVDGVARSAARPWTSSRGRVSQCELTRPLTRGVSGRVSRPMGSSSASE